MSLAGTGPVYLASLGTYDLETTERGSDGRFPIKTVWVGSAEYTGTVVLSGQRLDESGVVHFAAAEADTLTVTLPNGRDTSWLPDGWSDFTTPLRVPDPGCYRIEILGDGFTSELTIAVRQ